MGGDGSGRKPSPETIQKRTDEKYNQFNIQGEDIELPNLSGVKLEVISHGISAAIKRPLGKNVVIWIGSVEPTNAANGDVWIDTT